ncbi:retropepsin-like aspartic protease [Luteimonas deserti]|uniref:Clan AA aspartic protease n=1 Tax=Luteimonas deserti TaxID=2752306 RepID=A0A7Z0QSJ2_9GAMM|nr:retropepsin-like aspartic protease [Luteimonas deserti]NYZ63151.1 clan AA aspartic protease [Luteimonas deserti]
MPARLPVRTLWTGALAAALACTPVAAQNAVPAGVATALEAGGYASVPMRRHGDAHLTVEMRVNDVPGVFILDTGAGRTVIDRAAQSRFDEGRAAVAGGVATGAGGAGVAIEALPDSRLRIGDYRDEAFTVHVMPLDHVNAAFVRRGEAAVDGVLGADVLERGGAVIDYPNLRLYLRNPDAGRGAASSSPSISEQR